MSGTLQWDSRHACSHLSPRYHLLSRVEWSSPVSITDTCVAYARGRALYGEAAETDKQPVTKETVSSESRYQSWLRALYVALDIETHGIEPIPPERRTDSRLYELFSVWFSANSNLLALSTGTVGPAFFNLGLRESFAVIIAIDVLAFLILAYFGVYRPKLGTRVMVHSRFSFGYFGSIVPSVLNAFTLQGYLVLNSIIGGQALASVSNSLSWNVGIVIIALISLFITFCGYRVVHWYENIAWIPNALALIIMLGIGGKHLYNAPLSTGATTSSIISFASTLASADLSWCTMVADYGVHHRADASSLRIFIYTYLGFFMSSVRCAFFNFEDGNDAGGLFEAVLSPARGFGKLLIVLVALSVPSTCSPTMYSFGTSFMNVAPLFAKAPRNVYAIVSFAILIPLAILGSKHFNSTFVDLFSIIGYWTGSFSAVILTEHIIFRRNSPDHYRVSSWSTPNALPLGFAGLLSFFGSFGIIVPCMSQTWYEEPIARTGTGDIGIFVAIVATAILYIPLRALELKMRNDLGGTNKDW